MMLPLAEWPEAARKAVRGVFMRECQGVELEAQRNSYAFIGDSPNDAPMFAFFPNAIGVALLYVRPRGRRLSRGR